jgi:hypothetical protein
VRRHFTLALFGLVVGAPVVHAETVTVCDQKIEYTVAHRPETLSPEAKALFGVWDGEVLWDARARSCVGLLMGRIDENGNFDTKYAHNAAQVGINNVAKMGVINWRNGSYQNGLLKVGGPKSGFELRKVGQEVLEGHLIRDGQRFEAKFKGRKPPN